jgi:hypothetical protein
MVETTEFRFSTGVRKFALFHNNQIDSRAHPASYPMDTAGSVCVGKAAGAWN